MGKILLLVTITTLLMVVKIERKVRMVPGKQELDAALDAVEGEIVTSTHNAVVAESAAIIAAIQAKAPDIDLSDEIARLQALPGLISGKIAADVQNTLAPPDTTSSPDSSVQAPNPAPDSSSVS